MLFLKSVCWKIDFPLYGCCSCFIAARVQLNLLQSLDAARYFQHRLRGKVFKDSIYEMEVSLAIHFNLSQGSFVRREQSTVRAKLVPWSWHTGSFFYDEDPRSQSPPNPLDIWLCVETQSLCKLSLIGGSTKATLVETRHRMLEQLDLDNWTPSWLKKPNYRSSQKQFILQSYLHKVQSNRLKGKHRDIKRPGSWKLELLKFCSSRVSGAGCINC